MNDKIIEALKIILESDSSRLSLMSKGTLVYSYLKWLSEYVNIEKYKSATSNEGAPFLSIITRTQGKRPEALQEVLLCLMGQSDMDFELLILGHKLSEEQMCMVEDLIDNQPYELKERIRLIKVDYGTRTTPLNVGFSEAKGDYIAILDDDDIVFDNWVEEFKNANERKPGAILHAFTLSQKWQVVKRHVDGLRAVDAPTHEFCKKFNFLSQVNVNSCPPVGLAFPRYAFSDCGITFDETLNTTEDWDLFMRMAFLCDVSDIEKPTCIYRIWINTETSYTLHTQEEWRKNHAIIQDKFLDIPIVLPKMYSKEVIDVLNKTSMIDKAEGNNDSRTIMPALYLDFGDGYKEKYSYRTKNLGSIEKFRFEYQIKNSEGKTTVGLRWDPDEWTQLFIKELQIVVNYEDSTSERFVLSDFGTNGFSVDDGILFIKEDPQLFIGISKKSVICDVIVEGECVIGYNIEILEKVYNRIPVGYDTAKLYISGNNEYSEDKKVSCFYSIDVEKCEINYNNLECFGKVKKVRWKPYSSGMHYLKIHQIDAMGINGESVPIKVSSVSSNGIKYNNGYIFLKAEPWINMSVDQKVLSSVRIVFTIEEVKDEMLEGIIKYNGRILSRIRNRLSIRRNINGDRKRH